MSASRASVGVRVAPGQADLAPAPDDLGQLGRLPAKSPAADVSVIDHYMFHMRTSHVASGRRRRQAVPPVELPPDRLRRRAERLAEAVRARRVLQIRYGGAWRVVHPHALGRTSTGRLGLLTWQTAGVARGPDAPGEGWRLFDVTRIEDAQMLRATFTPRPRAPREGWTAGIAAPAAEVPPRETALAEAAAA